MTQDISGFGLQVQLFASATFPSGITITQFADDSDPLDMPSIQIADKMMGLNGDLIIAKKANPLLANLGIIPNGEDDANLTVLFEASRAGKGKRVTREELTMTITYPDGRKVTLTGGAMTDGMFADSVASAGRMKSKTYSFAFETMTTVRA